MRRRRVTKMMFTTVKPVSLWNSLTMTEAAIFIASWVTTAIFVLIISRPRRHSQDTDWLLITSLLCAKKRQMQEPHDESRFPPELPETVWCDEADNKYVLEDLTTTEQKVFNSHSIEAPMQDQRETIYHDEFGTTYVLDENSNRRPPMQTVANKTLSDFSIYDTSCGHCGMCGRLDCNGACFK
jgi:hypothetical protein